MNGLSPSEVLQSRSSHGDNRIVEGKDTALATLVLEIMKEPMFILLLIACTIYFITGELREGFIMLFSLLAVAGISLFQDYRSRNAVKALRKLSAGKVTVIREGSEFSIAEEDIVVGDLLKVQEGDLIGADGKILLANDLSVNESILTGESLPATKLADGSAMLYKGTLVTSGSAIIQITEVGKHTMFGKIGLSLQEIIVPKTPLQLQIKSFVVKMVWLGAVAFVLVVLLNYVRSGNLLPSFMQGLTLAMSILPEEIPVAFSTFQALAAFRLLKNNVIVKQPPYVETLGSATVICTDKTGTLTKNEMSVAYVYDAANHLSVSVKEPGAVPLDVIEYAMWSSETTPFDPMEKAIHDLYTQVSATDKRTFFSLVHEYPIGGTPPMMTHIFSNQQGETVIAAKGAPEAILEKCLLDSTLVAGYLQQALSYAAEGYRVLGVGKGIWNETKWPMSQQEFRFDFLGLLAFHDPPKSHIKETIRQFGEAGIRVTMITGDYAPTALAIANQVGLDHNNELLTGKEVLQLSPDDLQKKCASVNIYARMFPEAKLKVINALKESGEVVAMTGDGVNDGPALKAAHIGIAMGKRGSEVAKSAASVILGDDDLSNMVTAVALGRRMYDNLQKAIRYIVSIHIPIILMVALPLILWWKFAHLFSPVHVIFLELLMGPTCSIIYEQEPMEKGAMQRPPRRLSSTFLSFRQLMLSVIQGLLIAAGCLGMAYYYMQNGAGETTVRTVAFITLLQCNIFLTLVNRSFSESVFRSLGYQNNLLRLIIVVSIVLLIAILFVPFLRNIFSLSLLSTTAYLHTLIVAFVAVCWLEVWKYFQRKDCCRNRR